jgi:hypothetical protein
MFICPLCNKNNHSLRSASSHINKKHHLDAKDILFDYYPNVFRNCLCCDKKIKHYKSDSQSRKFCDKVCEISWRKNCKQSQETINKRIQNTDQIKKENSRQKTMLEKYGSLEYSPNKEEKSIKISKALAGIKHTREHHEKITQSKIKNNTLNHTQETKDKIREKVTKTLNSPDFDKSRLISHNKNNPNQGYHKGFYCRSSYERLFVDFCEEYNIELLSAENNNYAVKYESDGKIRTYFPDFYLVNFDLVVEIKPISMYDYGDNLTKFFEAKKKYRFEVLTEEEHILNKENWNLLYEHLCLI